MAVEEAAATAVPGASLGAATSADDRHRQVFRSMSEAFAVHEMILDGNGTPRDYRFLEVNPAFERMTGLPRGRVLGRCVTDVLPGIDPFWIDTYGRVVREGQQLRFERYEGQLHRWYDVLAFPTGPREFGVLFLDITERKRNDEVLAFLAQSIQSHGGERFFQDLALFLARVLDAQFVCIDRLEGDGLTAQTLAVWCDGVFEDNVSYALKDTPCGDVVGKKACCFPASVCQYFPRDQVLQDLRAESYVGVTLWRHDGTPIGLIAVIWRTPLPDPSVASTVLERVAVRAGNELERLEVERALQASEAHFREMVHSLPIPTVLVGERGETALLNHEFTRVLGYDLGDIPDVEAWRRRAFPDEAYRRWAADTWSAAVREARASGRPIPPIEYSVTCKDGSVRAIIFSALPQAGSLLVCLVDVTRERTLQAHLALTSRLAAMGTLVAGVAHEINNPLAATVAGGGVALEEARRARNLLEVGAPPDVEAQRRCLDEIVEALEDAKEGGQRVAQIVKDMATFANPDPKRTRLRLGEVADTAIRWMPMALRQGVDIRVEERLAPPVLASAGQLEQVVVNLLTNAAKATRPGSRGDIAIRIGPGRAGKVSLEVVDHGVGIDPTIRDRIFEPFFTTRQVGLGRGAGLGLAICHTIVTDHGGTITAESEVGKGSTFRVELPVAPAEA
jgi:signal transduction histidine kinase